MPQLRKYTLQNRTCYVYHPVNGQYFFDEGCYRFYLNRLFNCLRAYGLQLHTYALLPAEKHLLFSVFSTGGLQRLLDAVDASYDEYFHNRFGRRPVTGDRRIRAVTGGNLALDCQKFIELAPVRAGLATIPGDYPWSGYCVNALGGHGRGVTRHEQYQRFCGQSPAPFQAYRDYISSPFTPEQLRFLQQRLISGFPLVARPAAAAHRELPAGSAT